MDHKDEGKLLENTYEEKKKKLNRRDTKETASLVIVLWEG